MKRFLLSLIAMLAMTFMANAQVIYDFESGDLSDFVNDATYPWTIEEADGNHFIKSSNEGVASSTSAIELTYDFTSDGYIIFDGEARGEGTKGTTSVWDKCEFSIDNDIKFTYGAHGVFTSDAYVITAGTHTFKWSYTKDNSVNPTGDFFAIDNINIGYGSPCQAPTSIYVQEKFHGAILTWNGLADSYTMAYKAETETTWTEIINLTENTYTLSDLPDNTYEVKVQADCDAGNWVSTTFTARSIQSTANWYCYDTYTTNGNSYDDKYVAFTMQDPSALSVASTDMPKTYAAAYANGYVWTIGKENGQFYKATLDNDNKVIGSPIMIGGTELNGTATEMSYNPVDGKMYYVLNTENDDSYIKSFDMANPSDITMIGQLDEHMFTFAINANGEAYGINGDGELYSISLTDASLAFIGNTYISVAYVQSMAFDLETGELFWAQIFSGTEYGLYMVDPTTAHVVFVGQIGGGMEATGLFMSSGSTMPTTIEVVNLEGFETPKWQHHPNFAITVPATANYAVEEVNWYCNGMLMTADDVFDNEDALYYMTVTISPAAGFNFGENVIVAYNGDTTPYNASASTILENGNFLATTYNFGVTDTSNMLIYDFDDGTMQGWTNIDADGDGYEWESSIYPYSYFNSSILANMGHNASYAFMLSGSYTNVAGCALTPDNYLVSPEKGFYNNIAFFACGQDAAYAAEHFGVAVSTQSNTDPADFAMVNEWTLSAKDQGNWYEFNVDLSAYAGMEIWVAIRHFDVTDQFVLDIDDIALTKESQAGVNENATSLFTIYPNPTKDNVKIESEVVVNSYNIYDVTGAVIMRNEVNSTEFEVNMNDLPAGVYFIRTFSEGMIQNRKLIKE